MLFLHSPAPTGRLRPAVLVLLVLALGSFLAEDARALSPHQREGVVFGIGVGFSPGKVTMFPGDETARVESGWEKGVTPQLRLGYCVVRNRLLLSVTNQQWLYEQGILAEDKLRINSQHWSLAATWFPADPASIAGGLYLTAGVGIGNSRLTLLEPIENDPHGNKFEEIFKEDESGTALHGGVGFEFRITRVVAAGLSVTYVHQAVDGDIFESTTAVPVNLTLNWYW